MSQLRAFLVYASTGYLLQGARFLGAFLLRLITDPVTVGVINAAQIVAPIFTTLTSGLIFRALRELPSQHKSQQSRTLWTYLLGNICEALLIFIPFALVCIFTLHLPEQSPFLLVFFISLFAFSQRITGTIESMFMALARPRFTAQIRLLHLIELAAALLAVSLIGAPGYLSISAVFAVIVVVLAARQIPIPKLAYADIQQAMKINRYGAGLATEKILSAVALVIDGLVVSILLGPATLAGYSLGTAVRGAIGSIANSLYWALWPQGVKDHDATGQSRFSNPRMVDLYSTVAVVITLASAGLVWFLIHKVLPDYAHHLPVIMVVIASTVPMTIGDWGRAQLVVREKVSGLPMITIGRIILFVASVQGLSRAGVAPLMSIAWGAFSAFLFYMLAITISAYRHQGRAVLTKELIKRITACAIPPLVLG